MLTLQGRDDGHDVLTAEITGIPYARHQQQRRDECAGQGDLATPVQSRQHNTRNQSAKGQQREQLDREEKIPVESEHLARNSQAPIKKE